MDFLIATHNKKKREELHRILSPLGVNVFLDYEKGIELSDVDETGETFSENALLKAREGCKESGMPCIADDSGLMVDALDGRPGVYTARYMGEDTPYTEKMDALVKELEGVPEEKRTARFVSCAAVVFPDGREFTVTGTCEGFIGYEQKGDKGFGFDPIFYMDGKSFAEFSPEEKDAVSHRGKSLKALKEKLSEII